MNELKTLMKAGGCYEFVVWIAGPLFRHVFAANSYSVRYLRNMKTCAVKFFIIAVLCSIETRRN